MKWGLFFGVLYVLILLLSNWIVGSVLDASRTHALIGFSKTLFDMYLLAISPLWLLAAFVGSPFISIIGSLADVFGVSDDYGLALQIVQFASLIGGFISGVIIGCLLAFIRSRF